jgi:hypothetical protein
MTGPFGALAVAPAIRCGVYVATELKIVRIGLT